MHDIKDFKNKDCINTLEKLEIDDRIKLVWQWTKQNVISLSQFKILITYCK